MHASLPRAKIVEQPVRGVYVTCHSQAQYAWQIILGSRGVGLGPIRGLRIWSPHLEGPTKHKDTRMISRGCGKGPIENTYVQGSEFCTTPLHGRFIICPDTQKPSSTPVA